MPTTIKLIPVMLSAAVMLLRFENSDALRDELRVGPAPTDPEVVRKMALMTV
jgi:hypothetical protein